MRLNEILNTELRKSRYTGDYKSDRIRDDLGAGATFSTRLDPDDKNMVRKSGEKNPTYMSYRNFNGFNYYASKILEYGMSNNPFIPRIYVQDEITDERGKVYTEYTMERLYDYNSLKVKDLTPIAIRTFGETMGKAFMADLKKELMSNNIRNEKNVPYFFTDEMAYKLEDLLESGPVNTDNALLNEALDFLSKILKEDKRAQLDLALADNLLFRKSQYGFVPVISDPIA